MSENIRCTQCGLPVINGFDSSDARTCKCPINQMVPLGDYLALQKKVEQAEADAEGWALDHQKIAKKVEALEWYVGRVVTYFDEPENAMEKEMFEEGKQLLNKRR